MPTKAEAIAVGKATMETAHDELYFDPMAYEA